MSQTTGKKRGRKPKAATTTAAEDPESNLSSPQKVVESVSEDGGTPKKKKKALDSRFGGMTEEQIMEMLLPDHLKPGLEIVFIGINPGLLSAYLGHHYCNANNHFWPCMYESGLIPRKMSYKEDAECLDYGIGFTNIVPRTTRSSNDLTRKEIKEWSAVMCERMKELKPLVACFNGKGIYEIFSGGKCEVGIQDKPLPGTETVVYVMPSTSGRAASHPRRVDKLKFFHELKQLRDRKKLEQGQLQTMDVLYHKPTEDSGDKQENIPSSTSSSFTPSTSTSSTSIPSSSIPSSSTPSSSTPSSSSSSAFVAVSTNAKAISFTPVIVTAGTSKSTIAPPAQTRSITSIQPAAHLVNYASPVPIPAPVKLSSAPHSSHLTTVAPSTSAAYVSTAPSTANNPKVLSSPFFQVLPQGQVLPAGMVLPQPMVSWPSQFQHGYPSASMGLVMLPSGQHIPASSSVVQTTSQQNTSSS